MGKLKELRNQMAAGAAEKQRLLARQAAQEEVYGHELKELQDRYAKEVRVHLVESPMQRAHDKTEESHAILFLATCTLTWLTHTWDALLSR